MHGGGLGIVLSHPSTKNVEGWGTFDRGGFYRWATRQLATEDAFSELRRAEATGRPLGTPEFVKGLETLPGRKIARRAPVRKLATEISTDNQLELL